MIQSQVSYITLFGLINCSFNHDSCIISAVGLRMALRLLEMYQLIQISVAGLPGPNYTASLDGEVKIKFLFHSK